MTRLPALSRRSSVDGVPHRISRGRPAPVARRAGLGVMLRRYTDILSAPGRETRMAPGTQTAYDIDVADVEYLRHGDKPLLARLFKPRGSGPFPIMVELHGGAWVRGDRLNGNAANEALARKGVIVAALDFRVPPVAPYP